MPVWGTRENPPWQPPTGCFSGYSANDGHVVCCKGLYIGSPKIRASRHALKRPANSAASQDMPTPMPCDGLGRSLGPGATWQLAARVFPHLQTCHGQDRGSLWKHLSGGLIRTATYVFNSLLQQYRWGWRWDACGSFASSFSFNDLCKSNSWPYGV